MVEVLKKDLIFATYEAIFWWNRSESYYSKYFKSIPLISEDNDLFNFFKSKVFDTFLKDYSVRRNINKNYNNVDLFLNQLIELNFFDLVLNCDTRVIDNVSGKLLDFEYKSVEKNTKSLLSKIAFLVNPNVFSLYDSLAKESLYKIFKNELKSTSFNEYLIFLEFNNKLKKLIIDLDNFNPIEILEKFKETEAYEFFIKNEDAFYLRIVDKYLWIKAQKNIRNVDYEKSVYFTRTNLV